jgi:hypothetical protein
MSVDRWIWAEGPLYPPKRDPRADDPDYYYDYGKGWVKKTVWTVDNEPGCSDWEAYSRFLKEMTPEERSAIRTERRRRHDEEMKAKGLVRWRDAWVTPERAKELEKRFREGLKRSREIQVQLERSKASRGRLWYWC